MRLLVPFDDACRALLSYYIQHDRQPRAPALKPLCDDGHVWYFFGLPGGGFEREDYTKDPAWKNAGAPRAAFEELQRTLLE